MMAAARSMRPGGYLCETTIEDAAIILALFAFVESMPTISEIG